jgi:hypothetical protein
MGTETVGFMASLKRRRMGVYVERSKEGREEGEEGYIWKEGTNEGRVGGARSLTLITNFGQKVLIDKLSGDCLGTSHGNGKAALLLPGLEDWRKTSNVAWGIYCRYSVRDC